jgi:hypothetical protein
MRLSATPVTPAPHRSVNRFVLWGETAVSNRLNINTAAV